ncbi:MAG: hypothetical protein E7655_08825 [Ruminococcaceae bacterium]|nr:hypothetical protein [Oscillospiraceae bacterium]
MFRKHAKIALLSLVVLTVLAAAFSAVGAASVQQLVVSGSGVTMAEVGEVHELSFDLYNSEINNIEGVEIELRWNPKHLALSGDPERGSGIPATAQTMFSTTTSEDGLLTFAAGSPLPMLKTRDEAYNLFNASFEVLNGALESNDIEITVVRIGSAEAEYADKVFTKNGYINVQLNERVLYVSDEGTGDGSSPDKPLGHGSAYNPDAPAYDTFKHSAFYRAMDALKSTGGTMVIVGDTSVGYAPNSGKVGEVIPYKSSGNWKTPVIAEGKTLTITSVYDGVDYRTQGAEFVYDQTYNNPRIHFNGASIWENLTVKVLLDTNVWAGSVPNIGFMGYKTVIGDGIECIQHDLKTGKDPKTSNRYITLIAGSLWGNLRKSTDLTINSGTWYQVHGSISFGSATNKSDQFGDVNLTINGGTFKSSVYCLSTSIGSGDAATYETCRVEGNINATVNGGNLNSGIFMGKNGFINADGVFTLKINGGTFGSAYAACMWASGGSAFLAGTNKGTRILDFSGMDEATFNTVAHVVNRGKDGEANISLAKAFYAASSTAGLPGAGNSTGSGFDKIIGPTSKTVEELCIDKVGTSVYAAGDVFSLLGYEFSARFADGSYAELGRGQITANKTKLSVADNAVTLSYTYNGKTVTAVQPITVGSYLTAIELVTTGKTTYNSGELFDASGYTFKATYSDGTSKTVSGADMTVPQTALKGSDSTVTIAYADGAVSKTIILPVTVTSSYSGLELTKAGRTAYYKGETFDREGYVFTARFADGSSRTVDNGDIVIEPNSLNDLSLTKVTASYTTDKITHKVDVDITVTDGVKSLAVKTYGKQNYESGSAFDPTGYTFTATHYDGRETELSADQIVFSKERLTAKDSGLVASYTLGTTKVSTYLYLGVFPSDTFGDGKINSDDDINVLDLLVLLRAQKDPDAYIAEVEELADINRDASIDDEDAKLLFNKIVGRGMLVRWANNLTVNSLGQAQMYLSGFGMNNNCSVYSIDTIDGVPFAESTASFDKNSFFYLVLNDMSGTYRIETLDYNGDDYTATGNTKLTFTYGGDSFALEGSVNSATKGALTGSAFPIDANTRYIVHNMTTGETELAVGKPLNVKGNDPVITVRSGARVIIDNNIVFVSDGTIDGVFIDDTEKSFDVLNSVGFDIIGDSYVAGNKIGKEKTWSYLLGQKYGWDYGNFGRNGATISVINPNTGSTTISELYKGMDGNADIVMLIAGRNDFSRPNPIGTIHDTDYTTFLGAMNVVYKGMKEMYPNAMIVFGTSWYTGQSMHGAPMTDYTDAMMYFCDYYGIPCFEACDPIQSGVDMSNPSFRAQYCETATDTSHLNEIGMKLTKPNFERFIGVQYELFLAQKNG